MTPQSNSSVTVFFDSGSKCLGTLLAVVTHVGAALSCKAIDIGVHLIGSGFRSSLSVLSNFCKSFAFSCASWLFWLTAKTVFGKSTGITLNFLKSSQLMSMFSFSSLLTATLRVAWMLFAPFPRRACFRRLHDIALSSLSGLCVSRSLELSRS